MNNRTGIKKSVYKIRWAILLFIVAFQFEMAKAQDSIAPATVVIDTTLSFGKGDLNFIQKIIQPIKFRNNRNRNEKERIYNFMQNLVEKGKLKVDSATVYDIMDQLDTITMNSATISKSIDAIVTNYNLDKKASKEIIDSLKMQIETVIQEIVIKDKESKAKQELLNRNNDFLKQIREIQFSSDLGTDEPDSLADKKNQIRKRLTTKTNVIGWHNPWNKTEYLNYNYSYLSAINLYGYEIGANGRIRNLQDLAEFQKPGGVIDLAHRKNCDVHLTIYSKLPAVINQFLNNEVAKKTFLNELDAIISDQKLTGVNIYFDFINSSDRHVFLQFIRDVRQFLNSRNDLIQLNISIPAVKDDESLFKIGAFNFFELNQLVDYYFVLTDELTSVNNNIALTPSPLYNSDKYGQRTIESTVNFYSNGKIPISKLIVTLSYLGIEWNVEDFAGITVKGNAGKQLKYNEIVERYKNNQKLERTIDEGIDSSQVAAYLNISVPSTYEQGKFNKKQVWYENSNSLYQKYNWVLENNLGGVAIRGLGYDDGYSELWDVLGISFVTIDSVANKTENEKVQEFCPCLYDSLKNTTLENSMEVLEITNWKEVWSHFQHYKRINPDSSYLKIFAADYRLAEISDLRYAKNVPYTGDDKTILENMEACWDLISRWYVYSRILFGITLLFGLMAVFINFSRNFLYRFQLGGVTIQVILIATFWLSVIIALLSLLLGLFLEPDLDSIGAGNQGESNFWILIQAAIIGIVLGIIFKSSIIKNKYKQKNQP
ncbi:glycosyl hydrolase family 18 protein [Mariniphaga sp.]|uniref:glycosyl hydrolase family 18 protein n=1 Tax=Mariniphaga sp. TaxID=1954475 RepID=UPI00356B0D9D